MIPQASSFSTESPPHLLRPLAPIHWSLNLILFLFPFPTLLAETGHISPPAATPEEVSYQCVGGGICQIQLGSTTSALAPKATLSS